MDHRWLTLVPRSSSWRCLRVRAARGPSTPRGRCRNTSAIAGKATEAFRAAAVYAITQTADGYLWIGAEKGLVRFDGLTFQLFEPDGARQGIGPTVLGVVGAPDGSLWARLRGPALVRYRDGGFDDILPQLGAPESVVSAMIPGRGGSVLLATVGRGALIYRNGKFEEIAFTGTTAGPVVRRVARAIERREFWLGTRDAGLLRVSGSQITRVTEGLPDLKSIASSRAKTGSSGSGPTRAWCAGPGRD